MKILVAKVLHSQVFILVFEVLCSMWWRNLNIETEKSEQTVFAQISLSQY